MTLRQATGRSRLMLVPVALAALLLGGCTSDFLAGGAGPTITDGPTASPSATETATPTPTPPPTPEPTAIPCNLVFTKAENYVLGDCATVTIEGSNINVTFESIDHLVIRGNGARLNGQSLGDVQLSGQSNEIEVVTLGAVHIRGDQNLVAAEQTIHSVIVDGNSNTVTAGDGIDQKADNGIDNVFS
ncbi:MAG: DUF3060 domain-containing protein [Pseudolysinimonas sp.]